MELCSDHPYMLIAPLLLTGSSVAQSPDIGGDKPSAYTKKTRTDGEYGYGNLGLLGLFGLGGLFGLRRRERVVRGRREYQTEQNARQRAA
jgi:MYXO-CTERM domain-containing protein